jgi:hypothetical protein
MKVYSAINAVQAELATVGIAKTKQGNGFKFRGIDDVYQAIAPLLAKNGLCILPRVLTRQSVERQSKQGGALFYITVEVEFDFVAVEDGSKHTVKTFGEAMDSGDKATNKAMSAAYKYACFQAFAIPIEGTPDSDESSYEVSFGFDINEMANHLMAIQDAKTHDELKTAYLAAYKACGTDKNWQKKMMQAKDAKKASLT